MEVQKDIDDAFTIFCFFEDLHRLQDFLKQTWEEYKAGKCDLTIVSVTTNLAFNLVRRAEEELIANLDPKHYAKPRSYGALSMTIFYEDSFDKGEDPEERLASNESLKITPFDDFIYLPTARALMKFQRMIELGIQYPQPVPPFRFNYISRPELLELPETKKAEKEDLLLSQLCIDSSINDLILPGIKDWRKREPPPVDGFSKGLEKLRKDGEISAWIVFASRIILDINNILGDDVARSYKELQRAGRDAKAVLDFQSEGDELGPGPSSDGLCWHSKSIELPQNIWELVDFWLEKAPLPTVKEMTDQSKNAQREPQSLEDLPIEQRQQIERELRARGLHNDDVLPQHEANAKKMDLKPIKPAKEPTFLYTHNPLYCGTLTFNIAIDIELAGLALANHQLTIFAIAHLYNACQQTKIIESKWPEMERLIQMHIGQLFAGQLPTKLSECHTRLSVRLGAKASDFAPNRRANQKSQQLSGKGMKHTPKLAISDSSQILSDYSGDKEPAEKSLYRIEAAIQEYRSLQIGPAKRVTTRQLTPLQFLTHVRTWLPQITEDTKIDYITLVRTCNKLLKRVRKRIHQELGYLYPKADQGWSNDHGQIFMVASIIYQAADTQSFKEQVIKSRDRSRLPEDPQLVVAGDVLQELLPKHGAS